MLAIEVENMKECVLVVEDDRMIRELISFYLRRDGYEVYEAADGEEAKSLFTTYYPCLIILDLMLPKLSGEAFCQWVKSQDDSVSIIMLSAKARIADRIAGLKMGADDYMTKPFDSEELLAQVEAVLRRTGRFCQKVVGAGICIMPRKGEVFLHQEKIDLTRHEFELLYFLMRHPNQILSREELIEQLYPNLEKTVLDRTIDAHIKKLRSKVETEAGKPHRIQTVRGMGYKFVTS